MTLETLQIWLYTVQPQTLGAQTRPSLRVEQMTAQRTKREFAARSSNISCLIFISCGDTKVKDTK